MDAIINFKDYGETLRDYILISQNYKPNHQPYFKTPFSPETIKWAKGIGRGDSIGNGAMMRISPVGYSFNSEQDVIENAKLVTVTSHNSEEAIESATIIALMIYYFRNGLTKEEVYKKMNLLIKYEPFLKFNTTCKETLNNCLYAVYMSSSFEDAIRRILLMGGDTDTNCCIVGSIAEALYGMNNTEKEDALSNLPNEYIKILKQIY